MGDIFSHSYILLVLGERGGVLVGVKRPIPKGGGGDSMRNLSPPPPTEKQRI